MELNDAEIEEDRFYTMEGAQFVVVDISQALSLFEETQNQANSNEEQLATFSEQLDQLIDDFEEFRRNSVDQDIAANELNAINSLSQELRLLALPDR